jgi:heavy metal efflux system protein
MSQPISDRVDELVSGVRADVAVMLYGDDLDTLVKKANEIARVATGIQGTQDTRVDRVGGQQYLTIDNDRSSIARCGLNAADVNDVIETAIAGKSATEIYEGERRFAGVVRLPEDLRDSVEDIRDLQISSPDGPRVPLKDLSRVKVVEGPALINRNMGKRRIVVGVNVQDRDLGGYVKELQQKVEEQVQMPAGYYIEWGGQFHNMQRALHHLMVIVPITVDAIFLSVVHPLSVGAFCRAHHYGAPAGVDRWHPRTVSFRRVSFGSCLGWVYCSMGNCCAQWRGIGVVHSQAARRGTDAGKCHP